MDSWLGNRKRILVLNREDMISTADRNAWATYYTRQGIKVIFSNGQLGMVLVHSSHGWLSIHCIITGDVLSFLQTGDHEANQVGKGISRWCECETQSKRTTSSSGEFLG